MSDTNIELTSTISDDNKLELALREIEIPQPGENQVVIRVEAAPINPSDLGVMFSVADMTTASQSGSADQPVIHADVPAKFMGAVKSALASPFPSATKVPEPSSLQAHQPLRKASWARPLRSLAEVAIANTSVPTCKAVWNWSRALLQWKGLQASLTR